MNLKRVVIVLAIVAVVGLLYWPVFRWLVQSWLSDPYYSHGFLIPLVSGFFVWTKRRELRGGKPSGAGVFVITLGAFLYVLGFVWGMRFLSAFSLLIMLSGASFSFLGTRATRAMVFPLCFLIFMIPPPFMADLAFRLQTISVNSSAWLLEAVGVSVVSVGPEIHLGDTVFTIGLPCSGISALVAMLALTAVYVYLLKGPTYRRALLFVIAFPLAILANTLRIASIIMVADYRSVDAAMGFYHDVSSPLFFLIAFLFLVLLGRIIGCRLSPTDSMEKRGDSSSPV